MTAVAEQEPRTEAPNGGDINITRHVIEIYEPERPLSLREGGYLLQLSKSLETNPSLWALGYDETFPEGEQRFTRCAILNPDRHNSNMALWFREEVAGVIAKEIHVDRVIPADSFQLVERIVIETRYDDPMDRREFEGLLVNRNASFYWEVSEGRTQCPGTEAWAPWANNEH